jgi:hypothetical protein
MSRRPRRRKDFISRFVGLEHIVLNSPAFQNLSGDAVKLLLLVSARHNGENNGSISFSVREAAAMLPCTPNTAALRFQELQDQGFLVAETKGAFSVKMKRATIWRITLYPSAGGHPATRDYARWKPSGKTDEKQNTVSIRDTDGISQRYRHPKKRPPERPTVSPSDTVTAISRTPTVSPRDALIDSSHTPKNFETPTNPAIGSIVVGRDNRDVATNIVRIAPSLASRQILAIAPSETAIQKHDDELEIPAFLDRRPKEASGI